MSGKTIIIQNRIRILESNVLLVMGCEPTSAATSSGFPANLREYCPASYITLKKALEVIPGAKLIYGPMIDDRYFILPDGPPPPPICPQEPRTDWYDILRLNADSPIPEEEEEESRYDVCRGFNYSFNGCPNL